jgi:hypothetical protein
MIVRVLTTMKTARKSLSLWDHLIRDNGFEKRLDWIKIMKKLMFYQRARHTPCVSGQMLEMSIQIQMTGSRKEAKVSLNSRQREALPGSF